MTGSVVTAARLARIGFLFLSLASVSWLLHVVASSPISVALLLAALASLVAFVLLAAAASEFVPVTRRETPSKSAGGPAPDDR